MQRHHIPWLPVLTLSILLFAQVSFGQTEERIVVSQMVGQVEVRSTGAASWRAARVGMPVKVGWDIRTYVESSADLVFASGTVLKIGENSVVTVSKASGDGKSSSTNVKVSTGLLLANVKKLTSTKSSFEFETPTAVASIRGTSLGINVGKNGTSIDVYEGLVMVRPAGGGVEAPVGRSQRAVVVRGQKQIKVEEVSERKDPAYKDPFAVAAAAADSAKDSAKAPVDTGKVKSDTIAAASPRPPRGLTLTLSAPVDRSTVTEPLILVSGMTKPGARVMVNGSTVNVSPSGAFSTQVPIPDEPQDYPVDVVVLLGDNEMTQSRLVTYQPKFEKLSLVVNSPLENQKITASQIHMSAKISTKARLSVNGTSVDIGGLGGIVTYDIPISEKNIGDFQIDLVAANNAGEEISKSMNVVIDGTSPQINTSFPTVTVTGINGPATRNRTLQAQALDRTPDEQITLSVENNGSTEAFTMQPNERQAINLEEGKNVYVVKAFDLARNQSNVVRGEVYYLPGHLSIKVNEPSELNLDISDLPPALPDRKGQRIVNPLAFEVEIEDGIGNLSQTIKYCRVTGMGQSVLLKQQGSTSYLYTGEVSLQYRTLNQFTIQTEDIAGNMATKMVTVNLH